MTELRYTITLLSDAEPGTGLGTELINDLIPRDHRGLPLLPASHIKGLVREALEEIASLRGWHGSWVEQLFGKEGDAASDGAQGITRFSSACVSDGTSVSSSVITRTAIDDETGTVATGSLRVTESVPTGTTFEGSVWLINPSGPSKLMLALGLTSLAAIGGNRRRGSGRCTVGIKDRTESPSQLLAELAEAATASPPPAAMPKAAPVASFGNETVVVRLEFRAHDPVCCPEVPITTTNVLRGAFMIPASAVQGAILDRLNANNSDLATKTFEHDGFRAWPLCPVSALAEPPEGFPIWTSLTHRMTKLGAGVDAEQQPHFADEMVDPIAAEEVARAAPLKAADGVLIRDSDGKVCLWRARDMPRHVAAHVNLAAGDPRLFTVESLAPMVYRGLVSLPVAAWRVLEESIRQSPNTWFGKSRSTLGGGELSARLVNDAERGFLEAPAQIFVVQSPLLINAELASGVHAGDVLKGMVEGANFGRVKRAEASLGMRFGWNRRALGNRTQGRNRLRAAPVILPGSVFKLEEPMDHPRTALCRGIGDGRDRGFGAILPHPGTAVARVFDRPELPKLISKDQAGANAQELVCAAANSGLSTSQVAWLASLGLADPKSFQVQIKALAEKTPRMWDRWRAVSTVLTDLCGKNLTSDELTRTLTGWRDGMAAATKEASR